MTKQIHFNEDLGLMAARALVKAYRELNAIRARDGAPYGVDKGYFSDVVDEVDAAVMALTGNMAYCHPLLYEAYNPELVDPLVMRCWPI